MFLNTGHTESGIAALLEQKVATLMARAKSVEELHAEIASLRVHVHERECERERLIAETALKRATTGSAAWHG